MDMIPKLLFFSFKALDEAEPSRQQMQRWQEQLGLQLDPLCGIVVFLRSVLQQFSATFNFLLQN